MKIPTLPIDSLANPSIRMVSIVIVTHNSLRWLSRCKHGVEIQQRDKAIEVVLVDNASTDGTIEWVRDHWAGAQLVVNERNVGFAAANNIGLRLAAGDILVLLNSDAFLKLQAIEQLCSAFDRDASVGICGPQLRNPDGSLQASGNKIPGPLGFLWWSTGAYRLLRRPYRNNYVTRGVDYEKPRVVDEVSGACMALRREVYEEVGGLEESFFFYCEDVEYCWRAKKAGWKIQYYPSSKVTHVGGGSSNGMSQETRRLIAQTKLRYAERLYGSGIRMILSSVFMVKDLVQRLAAKRKLDWLRKGRI